MSHADDSVERWITYDSSGFSTPPWRLGTAMAPIASLAKTAETALTDHRRDYDVFTRLVALELVGTQGAVRHVSRVLRSGESIGLPSSAAGRVRGRHAHEWAPGGLVPFIRKLPSGPVHALLLHPQAVPGHVDPAKPVYAISRHEDLGHAYRMLDRAIPIPILPDWTPWLISEGEAHRLVFRLTTEDLWAIEIVPDTNQWAALVTRGVQTGVLACPS